MFNQQRNKRLLTTNALIEYLKDCNIYYEVLPDDDRITEHLFIAL
jgi:hypothetical protein